MDIFYYNTYYFSKDEAEFFFHAFIQKRIQSAQTQK